MKKPNTIYRKSTDNTFFSKEILKHNSDYTSNEQKDTLAKASQNYTKKIEIVYNVPFQRHKDGHQFNNNVKVGNITYLPVTLIMMDPLIQTLQ
jgi:hypothetical protein